ncbi:hypothetical protein BDR22DRAFT_886712 [Usnea florida]
MPTSTFLLSISILIAVHNVAQVFCGDQCFNIDQIQEQGYYPCDPSASTSNCCQPGWLCLSNGLCEPNNDFNRNPVTWTGFCTDPQWDNTTACPKVCQNNVTAASYADNRVSSCGDGHFCCFKDNNDTACCSTPSELFFLGVATVVASVPNSTSVLSTSAPSPSVLSTSARSTSVQSTSTPVTTGSGTSEISATAGPSAISSTQLATSKVTSKPSHTAIGVGAGVGAGVGVTVGLAILAAGFFYIKHRPSKTRDEGRLAIRAGSNNKSDDKRLELQGDGVGELPADKDPQELIDPKGSSWELNAMDIGTNGAKASTLADVAE